MDRCSGSIEPGILEKLLASDADAPDSTRNLLPSMTAQPLMLMSVGGAVLRLLVRIVFPPCPPLRERVDDCAAWASQNAGRYVGRIELVFFILVALIFTVITLMYS